MMPITPKRKLMANKQALTWTPAQVGCYWSATDFSICTRVAVTSGRMDLTYPNSGYVLTRNRQEIGIYKTLKAAQRAAERIA